MAFPTSTTLEFLCPQDDDAIRSDLLVQAPNINEANEIKDQHKPTNRSKQGYDNILLDEQTPPRTHYIQNSSVNAPHYIVSPNSNRSVTTSSHHSTHLRSSESKLSLPSSSRRPSFMNFISKGFTVSIIDNPETSCCLKFCCQSWLGILRLIVAIRAILVRIVFLGLTFGFIATVVRIKEESIYWMLCLLILPLLCDLCYSIVLVALPSGGKNYAEKWFTKCLLAYLLCACPPIWIIKLHHLRQLNIATEAIIQNQALIQGHRTTTVNPWLEPGLEYNKPGENMIIMGTNPEAFLDFLSKKMLNKTLLEPTKLLDRVKRDLDSKIVDPMAFAPSEKSLILAMTLQHLPLKTRISIIEQLLLLSVIIGRWLLPRFGISRDQLSQLLLINIGNAADILELFEAFNEDIVRSNHDLKICILCLWQASLLQFCFNKTATLENQISPMHKQSTSRSSIMNDIVGDCNRVNQVPRLSNYRALNQQRSNYDLSNLEQNQQGCMVCRGCSGGCRGDAPVGFVCFGTELWAICMSLMLQDVPFLALRLTLIFYFKVRSYSNVFFTCKNSLLILLQVFRSVVILAEQRRKANLEVSPQDIPLIEIT